MKAEIISVGTEILLGDILDTNSNYLAARLPALGIDLYFTSTVGDNLPRLAETIGRAHKRSDLVLITGGLGPTEDDLTREAIALAVDEELYVDEATEQRLRDFFAARGFSFPESNVKQATLIPSAQAIANPRGTAPGWWLEKEGKLIVAMPGPPAELTRMWEVEVAPRLAPLAGGEVIVSRTVKTIGIGEGQLDEMVSPLLKSTNPSVGVYAKIDGVHLRLTAKAKSAEAARELIEPVEAEVRRILGEAVWGVNGDTLEATVGHMLRERGLTLATMESCSGGLLASTITDVPGSSAYFKGGYVAYTPEVKIALGVSAGVVEAHGAVSDECAAEMARAARERAAADVGVSVTGVAGPDELEGKPPGRVHLAVDGPGDAELPFSYTYYQGREATKRRAVTSALALLRRALLAAD